MLPVWIRPWVLATLAIVGVFTLVWHFMAAYAFGWQRGADQTLAHALREPIEWRSLTGTAAGEEALLVLESHGRDAEVEACAAAGDCRPTCAAESASGTPTLEAGSARPIFNCLTPPAPDDDVTPRYREPSLYYLLRSDGERVETVARLLGEILDLRCGETTCYLLARLPKTPDQTLFASEDLGRHWHLAAQRVLEQADSMASFVNVARDNIWLADSDTLYASRDAGQHWKTLSSAKALLTYDATLGGALPRDPRFDWALDDAGEIHAYSSYRGTDGRGMVNYRLDADSGRILEANEEAGRFTGMLTARDGSLLALHESGEPTRYRLYRLRGEKREPLLETGGEPLRHLQGGRNVMLLDSGRGDRSHLLLSRDGDAWIPMASRYRGERALLDPSGAGILEFGYPGNGGRYPYRWLRPPEGRLP
ncbi:hypothetical protein [Salinicola aestuarinus]|uniref:hypothetical protein n=1 Tax=Salinicola aestuarinus TaxID=1949082 RepID=UPI000DA19CBB|nr:hypothetical protein [Salinicola aestuarinus]